MTSKVLVLADIYPNSKNQSENLFQEWESEESINYLLTTLKLLGHSPEILEPRFHKVEILKRLQSILEKKEEPNTIVWNLVEGYFSPNREAYIPSLAEFFGIPFAGSPANAQIISLNKELTLRIAKSMGIPTPQFRICESKNGIPLIKEEEFPVFVKPVFEGSSLGINSNSIIHKQQDLVEHISSIAEAYFPLLIEEYLPGKEFTVGIMGQNERLRSLRICEIITEGVYSEIVKSKASLTEKIIPQDENIFPEIKISTIMLSKKIGASGYGRADWKLNKLGKPVFLEINLTPGLSPFYSSFPITYEEGKDSYLKMISEILEISILEYNSLSRRYGKSSG
jgi:D-alanine-D-alanine ligase